MLNSDSINNPDFAPVILKRAIPKSEMIKKGLVQSEQKKTGGKNVQNKVDVDLRKIENESIKLPTVSHDMKLAIQQGRQALGITQKELATKTNLPIDVIRNYENGTSIVKQNELSLINKILGLHLKKPKPESIAEE